MSQDSDDFLILLSFIQDLSDRLDAEASHSSASDVGSTHTREDEGDNIDVDNDNDNDDVWHIDASTFSISHLPKALPKCFAAPPPPSTVPSRFPSVAATPPPNASPPYANPLADLDMPLASDTLDSAPHVSPPHTSPQPTVGSPGPPHVTAQPLDGEDNGNDSDRQDLSVLPGALPDPLPDPVVSTQGRRLRKANLLSLNMCTCGITITEAEIDAGTDVMRCRIQGCETIWVCSGHSCLLFFYVLTHIASQVSSIVHGL